MKFVIVLVVGFLFLTMRSLTQKVRTEKVQTITTLVVLTLRRGVMKRISNPVIPDYTPKQDRVKEEVKLSFKPCLICQKQIKDGYYGVWIDGGTCSKTCEIIKETQPRVLGE